MKRQGPTLTNAEIDKAVKSGSTVDSSFFAGMETLSTRLAKGSAMVRRLIYGGSERQQRQGVAVTPWSQIQNCRR